jgi:hypothetical protein
MFFAHKIKCARATFKRFNALFLNGRYLRAHSKQEKGAAYRQSKVRYGVQEEIEKNRPPNLRFFRQKNTQEKTLLPSSNPFI